MKNNVLFVVRALPYESSGTPVVIRNLLMHLPAENFYVLGRSPHPQKRLPNTIKQKMVEIPILHTKGHRFWKYYSILPGLIKGIWMIRKYKITKIIGVFQDDASLILAYLLALVFPKMEFYPYLMDLYAEQYPNQENLQQKIFNRSKNILVVNNGIREFLLAKYSNYNFSTVPIIASNSLNKADVSKLYIVNKKIKIVYSGSVNPDRIENLKIITAIISNDHRFNFKYLTHHTEQYLRNENVFYDGFELIHCKSTNEIMYELNEADLLYLPIRFSYDSKKKSQMQTVFGAKTFEYLMSESPIFVHCPEEFYNGKFLKENNAAFILNSINENEVKKYLDYILEQYTYLAPILVKNAHRAAQQFSENNVIKNFYKSIEF